MAPFKNLFGEVSPDETIVKIQVVLKDGTATIKRVLAENSKGESEELTPGSILNESGVTPFVQKRNLISPNIDTQPGNFDAAVSISRVPHEVVYMDVGRWGGPTQLARRQRNFGVVWGPWVALFDFEPRTAALDSDEHLLRDDNGVPRANHPINDFIRQTRAAGASLRLLRSMYSGNPNFLKGWSQDFQTLYVILPDLHLPVCTSRPAPPDGSHMGRVGYRLTGERAFDLQDDEGLLRTNGPPRFGFGSKRWFDNYLGGDIFGGPGGAAAKELEQFLQIVENIALPDGRIVHFVQVGDMYDMWIGLHRFFSEQPTHSVVLANGVEGNTGILAGKFIDFWADRTHLAFESFTNANLVARMNRMATNPKLKTSWLWGNHDNYLSVHTPQVTVGAAVPTRIRKVHTGGVLIEHGQRGDPQNRDGAISGHGTTNDVFQLNFLRALDPNRRNFFTALAAVSYVSNPDFHVFVMGHTHSPFLTRIRIQVRKVPF